MECMVSRIFNVKCTAIIYRSMLWKTSGLGMCMGPLKSVSHWSFSITGPHAAQLATNIVSVKYPAQCVSG